jgi:AraC-like DNA-binding protein
MSDEALVHLRVPAAVKGRWVRESRADGQRLSDWLIQRIERNGISQEEIGQLCQVFGVSEAELAGALKALRQEGEKAP